MPEPIPLSASEEEFLTDFVERASKVLPGVEDVPALAEGQAAPWILSVGSSDTLVITELVPDWGGVGRREPIATIRAGYGDFAMARLSASPDRHASSLLVIDPVRGPFAIRFLPFDRKNTLRFMVGEPGHRASVWRLWAGRNTDDVYLGDRQSIRYAKFSFHQSGDWRLQYTSEDRHEVLTPQVSEPVEGDRIIRRWAEPPPRPNGWVHAASISTSSRDVVDVPRDLQGDDSTIRIEAPPPGWSAEFMVFLVTPDLAAIDLGQFLSGKGSMVAILGGFILSSGRTLVLIARTVPIPPGVYSTLREVRRKAIQQHSGTSWSLAPESAPRSYLHNERDDGPIMMWDVALAKQRTQLLSSEQ